jgi:hypothetical protein
MSVSRETFRQSPSHTCSTCPNCIRRRRTASSAGCRITPEEEAIAAVGGRAGRSARRHTTCVLPATQFVMYCRSSAWD